MNWLNLKLYLFVLILFTLYFVNGEGNDKNNLHYGEEELIPREQTVNTKDTVSSSKKRFAKITDKHASQILQPYRTAKGQNFVGQTLDGQEPSASNNVLLVLDNDRNKLAELVKPAEESIRRLARNPDAFDDIVEQFQQFGGNIAQQVAQSAPEMARSFGQALNEALAQTTLLAQAPPGNLNVSQISQNVAQPNLPDFGQLGHSLSQSFMVGATQNHLKPQVGQNTPETNTRKTDMKSVSTLRTGAKTAVDNESKDEQVQQSPFESIVGQPLLSPFNLDFPTLSLLSPFKLFNPLLPLASEVSEVRVRPDNYNPYKLTPKEIDHHTKTDMKLKAVLRDALAKKTIPILWFHLPSDQNVQKSAEEFEMETKLKMFENQVIAELKQLQELSKLANEMKMNKLQSGSQPTTSLTTKLNLSDIPIYDITLGDIEKTIKDEHVIMLMRTVVNNQNSGYHRHHQTPTKYLTDLTGTPIKRQTISEDALKTMGNDDILKMMTYAYRMAVINGHEMPWLKNQNLSYSNSNGPSESTTMSQDSHSVMNNMEMIAEKQWLEDKQQQIAMEAERQRKLAEGQQNNYMRQWVDPSMSTQKQSMMSNTQNMAEQQRLEDKQRQMAMEAERQRKLAEGQQNNYMRQWVDPKMTTQKQSMMGNTQNMAEQQWLADKQRQMAMEAERQRKIAESQQNMRQWSYPNNPIQMQPMMGNTQNMAEKQWLEGKQRQMAMEAERQRKLAEGQQNNYMRQWVDPKMTTQKQSMMGNTQNMAEQQWLADKQRQMAMDAERQRKLAEGQQNNYMRQWVDPKMTTQKQPMMGNTQNMAEQQWLEDKQRQMAMEAERQRKIAESQQNMRQWSYTNNPIQMQPMMGNTKMTTNQQWLETNQRQMTTETTMQTKKEDANKQTDTQQNMSMSQLADPNMHMKMQSMMGNTDDNTEKQGLDEKHQEMMREAAIKRKNNNENEHTNIQENTSTRQWVDPNKPMEEPIQLFPREKPKRPIQVLTTDSEVKPNANETINSNATGLKTPIINYREPKEQPKHGLLDNTKPEFKNTDTTSTTTKPQAAENADSARFIGLGLKDMFDELSIFDKGKGKNKHNKPNVYNYYYNTGGYSYPPMHGSAGGYPAQYPPSPPYYGSYTSGHSTHTQIPYYGSYTGGGHSRPTQTPSNHQYPVYYPSAHKYKPTSGSYGGGGLGSNAYGSYGGYHRAAVGDEEIAIMLRQHQLLPRMMMSDNDDPLYTINTTVTEQIVDNANTTKNDSKRLAKNGKELRNGPAAYLLVVRNSSNTNNNKKSRSKRSTEYATLEPIDENSLNVLRKTYKNSLKEITLNPNETPEEALMRYNAESIREALEKANQQPIELTADAENHENVKHENQMEHNQQELHDQQVQMAYVLDDNEQFVTVPTPFSQSHAANGAYKVLNVPLTHQQFYGQQPGLVYASSPQYVLNNDYAKYNTPSVFESIPQIIPQNPYLSIQNSLDSMPYADDHSVANQLYKVASPKAINSIPKTSTLIYQKSSLQPQLNYSPAQDTDTTNSNVIAQNLQHIYSPVEHMKDHDRSKVLLYTTYPEKISNVNNPHLLTNALGKQPNSPQIDLNNRVKTIRPQERISFEDIMTVIKERLTQCCNECKNKILKSIEETFKHKRNHNDNASPPEKLHILSYRKPSKEEDVKYKQWLMKMSEKGYNKNYLTKQHQKEYLKDGRIHLHIMTEDNYGPEDDKVFSKNNQSHKRETTEFDLEKEERKVAAPLKIIIEKLNDNETETEKKQELEDTQLEQENKDYGQKAIKEKEIKGKVFNTINTDDVKAEENTLSTQQTTETTTHSVYAMRGQFRSQKQRPMPFAAITHAKHFDTYKNINKFSNAKAFTKTEDKKNVQKNVKMVEILNLLQNISQHNKDQKEEDNKEKVITSKDLQAANASTETMSTINVISRSAADKLNSSNTSKKRIRRKSSYTSKNPLESGSSDMELAKSIG